MDWLQKIPIGQYVAGKSGWIRFVDPRIKLAWVLMFLLSFPFVAAFMYLLHGVLDIYLRDPFLQSIGVMG